MTAYRAGQREIRVEWPDGSAAEGIVEWSYANGWAMPLGDIYVGLDVLAAKPTSITVLSEPRPDEPTGMGAVVRAGIRGWDSRIWVRTFSGRWVTDEVTVDVVEWRELIDPVVLSEGWTS